MAITPGNTKYCRPSDIITSEATWTAPNGTISTDPNYQFGSLYDRKMAIPTKFIDEPAVDVRIVADFGTTVRIDALALPNSKNIAVSAAMRAELNNTNVWTSPTVSVAMPMGAAFIDGHVASPWADFTAASGYSVSGFRYASLFVPAGSTAPWLGEVLLISQLREFSEWPQFDGQRGRTHPFLENIYTEYGQRRVSRRLIKQRKLSFSIKGNDADFEDLQTLGDDAGGVSRPFFMVQDSNIKTDGGLYGRFTPDTVRELMVLENWYDINTLAIVFEEDSRSIPM